MSVVEVFLLIHLYKGQRHKLGKTRRVTIIGSTFLLSNLSRYFHQATESLLSAQAPNNILLE